MKVFLLMLLFLTFLSSTASCAIIHKYGPYYGKVVDAETKEPLEGAAVLAVFYTEEYGPAGAITRYADAIETTTDKNGEFTIPAHRVTVFRLLQGWDSHGYFTIFKLGYGHYPDSKGVNPMFTPNGSLPAKQYVTIELPKLKTKEEIEKNGLPRVRHYIPYKKQKIFINLVNQGNELLGIKDKYTEDLFEKE